MLNTWIINNFLPVLLALIIEYFVLQPFLKLESDKKSRFFFVVLVTLTLLAPLFLWQRLALIIAESIGSGLSTINRVDIYANTYGLLAVFWGYIWTVSIRHHLYQGAGSNP